VAPELAIIETDSVPPAVAAATRERVNIDPNARGILCLDEAHGEDWAMYLGDCVDIVRQFPDDSVDFSVYSPPFSNLYCYSDSARDMGNTFNDAEFLEHYRFLVVEMMRVMRPGRCIAVHCKDLVNYKGADGMAGLRDFPGDIIRLHQDVGFAYASKVTIWKCPVTEMQRTKNHGLLWKQLRKDSTFSRQGLAEYVVMFRKWARTEEALAGVVPVTHTKESFPVERWQDWASPVWMDIDQTNVLNTAMAREDRDSKHQCPLQLDLIERCVTLWSNRGETVLSPFCGIGSEGVVSRQLGRRFVGVELKRAYWEAACKNVDDCGRQRTLFDEAAP
jgi:DNA modification methylase